MNQNVKEVPIILALIHVIVQKDGIGIMAKKNALTLRPDVNGIQIIALHQRRSDIGMEYVPVKIRYVKVGPIIQAPRVVVVQEVKNGMEILANAHQAQDGTEVRIPV